MNSGKVVHFVKTFGSLVSFLPYLMLVLFILYKIFKLFSGKIVTSLAFNFSMQKSIFKIIFGHQTSICEPIFKIFVALFRTKYVRNINKIIFV